MPTIGVGHAVAQIEQEYRRACEGLIRCVPVSTPFDAASYDSAAVAKARETWSIRMASEHQSAAVFLRLSIQLMEAGATLDAQALVTRMAFDETRHAEVCGGVLVALGADPSCSVSETTPDLGAFRDVSAEERALRNVLYTSCLTETVNVARFVQTLDATTDPCIKEGIRQLLSDEVHHSGFGFQYLETWMPWMHATPGVVASMNAFLKPAFADVERTMSLAGEPHTTLTNDERALGIPDLGAFTQVFYETMTLAVVPALERFGLDAKFAYEHRSMDGWV